MTPAQAAAQFAAMAAASMNLAPEMERAAQLIETRAKAAIGTYAYGWPPLAASTLAKKAADTPLLETGAMRDSIGHVVAGDGMSASVGSNEDKAVWQELGTSRGIPPRSFLAETARRSAADVVQIIGTGVGRTLLLGSGRTPSP